MNTTNPNRNRLLLCLLLLFTLLWPPVYMVLFHPVLSEVIGNRSTSANELKTLLDARRYTIRIPQKMDGWVLTFESIIDGQSRHGGGATVQGESDVTLLLRRNRETRKLEYCWYGEGQLARGILDDPLAAAGVSSERREGAIENGDWLLRGGRQSLKEFPIDKAAEFELRLAFTPPFQEELREH